MAYVLLGVAQVAGLLLLPIWSLGIWLQLGALALFGWWGGFEPVGAIPILVLLGLALAAELAEPPLAAGAIPPPVRKRASIGALLGGMLGGLAGVPFPLVGSLFGAFVGALLGGWIGALRHASGRRAFIRAVGQGTAVAVRATAAIGIAAFALYSVWG